MNQEPPNKVINLSRRRMVKHGVKDQPTRTSAEDNTRVIAITSGKGGVGKTNIVANLGFSLSQLGKKVLILDADVGLGNLDILLGLTPRYNLSHVIAGIKTIGQITMDGPGNMTILPASSGIQELSELTKEQKIQILSQLDSLLDPIDVLLIDTAAGISSNVMSFSCTAQEIIVVVSPEPTSITDAYALMKVLFLKHSESHFKLLVNLAHDSEEADEVFRQLNLVAQRFLDISIEYIGHVLLDSNLTKSVKRQKLVCETYPNSVGSGCFTSLAHKISESRPKAFPEGHSHFFWDQIL